MIGSAVTRPRDRGFRRRTDELGLDGRFWLTAFVATVAAFAILGVPTAVIPNPWFIRMTPTEPFNVATMVLAAPLMGVLTATYLARPSRASPTPAEGGGRVTIGGVAAYLAIGCPVCNKIIVAVLGVSGALNVFAPVQPLIGAGSVLLLSATLVWRLRRRSEDCVRCAPTAMTT